MFTLDQIKTAHSKVKSGADFPKYVQELIAFGLLKYDVYVSDGHADYFGKDGLRLTSDAKYPPFSVAEKADAEGFAKYLKAHQQGQSDYLAFCGQAAETGVEKWTVDTVEMTCIYYDKKGNKMRGEQIPRPGI